jgi:hypothetical protein
VEKQPVEQAGSTLVETSAGLSFGPWSSLASDLRRSSMKTESTPELRPQVQGVTNRTIPLTMMAMSLALGASPAEMTAGTSQAEG